MSPLPILGSILSIRCALYPLKIGANSLLKALLTLVTSSSRKFGYLVLPIVANNGTLCTNYIGIGDYSICSIDPLNKMF